MKVILVENDDDVIDILEETAKQSPREIEILVARSQDSAIEILTSTRAQLAIFDLQIPTTDGALDEDVLHGMHVFHESTRLLPGTPRIVWSGRATGREYEQIIAAKTEGDPYGLDEQTPMLEFFNKDDLRACAKRVVAIAGHMHALSNIRVSPEPAPLTLSDDERLVLQQYARRVGGTLVRVSEVGGGLSDARAFRSRVYAADGRMLSRVLAKVGPVALPQDEHARFRRFVTGVLDGANFAPLAGQVEHGAGPLGGLFYGLLEEFESSLFGLVGIGETGSAAPAAKCVARIQRATANWHHESTQSDIRFVDIRRSLVKDARKARVQAAAGVDLDQLDELRLYANAATQHGDLHGENILVAQDGHPVLIDFARTGEAFSALDPVTLELSVLFHPDSPLLGGSWPAPGQGKRWAFIDEYLVDCPVPAFVKACRTWAFDCAAEAREVYAHVASFALRQLDYDDTNKVWAKDLFDGACVALKS
jgi:CheY-like chemotaxis protein